jgi:hypothetical protein
VYTRVHARARGSKAVSIRPPKNRAALRHFAAAALLGSAGTRLALGSVSALEEVVLKAQFVSSVVSVLVLASTAHAQLYSEVRYGESFELDEYVTEQGENGVTSPWLYWNLNKNIRINAGAIPGTLPACYFVPGRLNVIKGDAVLSAERGSLIYQLLASIGQAHSHSGMARDSTRIRHNTMQTAHIDKVEHTILGIDFPTRLKATGSESLREGYPGTATHSVEAAMTHHEFNLLDGLVLYAGGTGLEQIPRILQLGKADAEMVDFRSWYRLFAYTDMTWRDPYTRSNDDGNMCSGSIFHAHLQAGNSGWTWNQRRKYTADVRQPAAALLYARIRDGIVDDADFLDTLGMGVYGTFGDPSLGELARRIANQVVNCMAFNDCGNITPRWQQGVGAGASVSPDDLHTLAYVNVLNAHLANTPNNFAYTMVKPLEKTGDYLCCVRADPDQFSPLRYTQCLRQY